MPGPNLNKKSIYLSIIKINYLINNHNIHQLHYGNDVRHEFFNFFYFYGMSYNEEFQCKYTFKQIY